MQSTCQDRCEQTSRQAITLECTKKTLELSRHCTIDFELGDGKQESYQMDVTIITVSPKKKIKNDAVYCRQLVSEILYNQPDSRVIEIFGFVYNMQLFDQISSTKQCSDKRIRLDVAEIQETVAKEVSSISWTPTADMLADCLTKRGADFSKLAKVVEEGFCDAITKC
ncbi:hypothetical protein ACHWQZ_G003025 [Mnemiopsis leidyi]